MTTKENIDKANKYESCLIGLKYYLDRSEEPNIEFVKASINNNLSVEAKKRLKELIKK